MKIKTSFVCQSCGSSSAKWIGKCPSCNEWNTYVEEVIQKEDAGKTPWRTENAEKSVKPRLISQINSAEHPRILTSDSELNRVLGGGIVPGSLVLIGGEPGIGKSTLMLQTALKLAGKSVLYISGEESDQQIKMRADRLFMNSKATENGGADLENCFILTETSMSTIFAQTKQLKPDILVIDSVQTLTSAAVDSAAGSVSQVRECTAELLRYSKETGTAVFLIGHITKDGMIAGPKVLEHMVDTVLQFEGDRHLSYRLLRTVKNRFGSASELGVYEMTSTGLREVTDPSEILISQREVPVSGVAVAVSLEGNRPLAVEVQALVSSATYGTPQRSSTGFDSRRLNMLLAVLEKRGGYRIGAQDVFLNVAGGVKTADPAADLAVCLAVVSSYENIPVSHDVCFAAEVGLGGEIRAVHRVEERISAAEKQGFKTIFISKYNKKGLDVSRFKIDVRIASDPGEVVREVLV